MTKPPRWDLSNVYASLEALEQLPQPFVDYTPMMEAAQAEGYYAGWQAAVWQVLAERHA